MATTLHYKIIDLTPDHRAWTEQVEAMLNQQAMEGWELVTAFQREHEAQQVGSTTMHVSGLVSTVLIFKRAG
jgi:Domain of unknown function (DUF4177)